MHSKLEQLINHSVSQETFLKIEQYIKLIQIYNAQFNLIGPKEMDSFWDRHIFDCAQLFPYLVNSNSSILDMGTGAGLPGMLLAILGIPNINLNDSKKKKIDFLEIVSRETNCGVKLIHERIENLPYKFDIIIGRAVAPLVKLLEYSLKLSHKKTKYYFYKGKNFAQEIQSAELKFKFKHTLIPSKTSHESFILNIYNLSYK